MLSAPSLSGCNGFVHTGYPSRQGVEKLSFYTSDSAAFSAKPYIFSNTVTLALRFGIYFAIAER